MCKLQVFEGIHSGPAYESTTEAVLSILLIKSDMVPAAASVEHADEPGTTARTTLQGAKAEVAVAYTLHRCMACTSPDGHTLQKQSGRMHQSSVSPKKSDHYISIQLSASAEISMV